MGTPDFAVPILRALAKTGHQIVAVYCQPPRNAGRGQKKRLSPVHSEALEQGYEVRVPTDLQNKNVQESFRDLNLDVAVVAAYGLILPKTILRAPINGCLNVHASLLPRWRGAAPIQRSILAGDRETGVTIMQMDQGLDTGPILIKERIPITAKTTGQSLHDQLSVMGAGLIIEALSGVISGVLKPLPQPRHGICYAVKLDRNDGCINWKMTSQEIDRQVRAFSASPGAWFKYGEDRIKVLKSKPVDGSGVPGLVFEGLAVSCGEGVLQLESVQRPGKVPMDATEFLNGYDIPPGTILV